MIISSFAFKFNVDRATLRAAVPLVTASAYFELIFLQNNFSKSFVLKIPFLILSKPCLKNTLGFLLDLVSSVLLLAFFDVVLGKVVTACYCQYFWVSI